MNLHEIPIESLSLNPFTKMKDQWMLIAAGDETASNLMTASWGMFGVLWRKYMFQIYIRPQRYTKQFVDACDLATLSFLPETYKNALKICGTTSGKEVDKWKLSNLHPYYGYGTTAVAEAELVIIGRKQYSQWFDPKLFYAKDNDFRCYPEQDYHEMYVYEVIQVLAKDTCLPDH